MALGKSIYEEITKIDIRLKPKEHSTEVLKVICNNLGYHFGSIILVDEAGVGSIFAAYNLPETYPDLVHKVSAPVLSSPSGTVIKTGKLLSINDVMTEPRLGPWYKLLSRFSIKTIVWVPLFSKGKAFGTYNLYDTHKRYIHEEEREILNQLGMIFSMAIIGNEYIDQIREKNLELEKEIRERRQVEKELRQAKESAEAAAMAKSEFLANTSHEIRTPMNAILGFVELLAQEEKDPGRQEIFSLITSAGERLISVITGLLDLSDIETDRIELRKEEFSIRELLHHLGERFSLRVEEQNLKFNINIDEAVPRQVIGDKDRVDLVIFHILDNAFKFTEKGSITVDCSYNYEKKCGTLVIKVTDTGIGIPPEKQENIFAIFTQVDGSATRKYGGTGLGLAIAGKLAAKMSGKISLQSETGTGSTFTIELALPAVN